MQAPVEPAAAPAATAAAQPAPAPASAAAAAAPQPRATAPAAPPHACPHIKTVSAAKIRQNPVALRKRVCQACANTTSSAKKLEAQDRWVCLTCGAVGCGRSDDAHALRHHTQNPSHALAASIDALSVWCYACERPVVLPDGPASPAVRALSDCLDLLRSLVPAAAAAAERPPAGEAFTVVGARKGKGRPPARLAQQRSRGSGASRRAAEEDAGPPRAPGVRGLRNLGNTCFFNSVVQNLTHAAPLVGLFVGEGAAEGAGARGPFSEGLMSVLEAMYSAPGSTVNPSPLFTAVCKKHVIEGLMKEWQPEDKRGRNPVAEMFAGKLASSVTCHACGHASVIHEGYVNLSLPIPGAAPRLVLRRAPEPRDDGDAREADGRAAASPAKKPPAAAAEEAEEEPMSKHHRKMLLKSRGRRKQNYVRTLKGKQEAAAKHDGEGEGEGENEEGAEHSPAGVAAARAATGAVEDLREHAGPAEHGTLEECLRCFTDPEVLAGADRYNCERCRTPQTATKQYAVHALPRVLVVQIKRFTQHRGRLEKVSLPVRFPLVLNMAPYAERGSPAAADAAVGRAKYVLFGVSEHGGSLSGGHYTAAVRCGQGEWYHFSDSCVSKTTLPEAVKASGSAYMLFYERHEPSVVTDPAASAPATAAEQKAEGSDIAHATAAEGENGEKQQ
eukprot:m51a1_g9241 putative probable ubiquitin carboxyl-terminal hydrolase 8 (672) ;mRNA; r:127974-131090